MVNYPSLLKGGEFIAVQSRPKDLHLIITTSENACLTYAFQMLKILLINKHKKPQAQEQDTVISKQELCKNNEVAR